MNKACSSSRPQSGGAETLYKILQFKIASIWKTKPRGVGCGSPHLQSRCSAEEARIMSSRSTKATWWALKGSNEWNKNQGEASRRMRILDFVRSCPEELGAEVMSLLSSPGNGLKFLPKSFLPHLSVGKMASTWHGPCWTVLQEALSVSLQHHPLRTKKGGFSPCCCSQSLAPPSSPLTIHPYRSPVHTPLFSVALAGCSL